MTKADRVLGIVLFVSPLLWVALCGVLAFFSNWAYYAFAASGFLLLSALRCAVYFWTRSEGDRNKIGLFSFVMVSLLPFSQLGMLLTGFYTHNPAPWMVAVTAIPVFFEFVFTLLPIIGRRPTSVWIGASAMAYAIMPLGYEIITLIDPSRGDTSKVALIIVAFVSVFLVSILMGPLFLMNKGIPLIKKIVGFAQKYRIGLFVATTHAFAMAVMTVVYLFQNNLTSYWSLVVFYLTLVFVRVFSYVYEGTCRRRYPNDKTKSLHREYGVMIICAAAILVLGDSYGLALTAFAEWDISGSTFEWYTINTIIFIGLRVFLSVRSLLESTKEKSPARFVNYTVDLLDLVFAAFSLSCLILKTTGWEHARTVANILWYIAIGGSAFFVIRMFVLGINGRREQGRILEAREAEHSEEQPKE